jgi:hypothetical protein
MGFKATAEIIRFIEGVRGVRLETIDASGFHVVVDFLATLIPAMCTRESIDELARVDEVVANMILRHGAKCVCILLESSNVPKIKSEVQQARDGETLSPEGVASFMQQWAGESSASYHSIAPEIGAKIDATDDAVTRSKLLRRVTDKLRRTREVRSVISKQALANLKARLQVPYAIHGDTVTAHDMDAPVPPDAYVPGEGEFKIGAHVRAAAEKNHPVLAMTCDSDAIFVMLYALPPSPRDGQFVLRVRDNLYDIGALRRSFASREEMDRWTLQWMMHGTDYFTNPPGLGKERLARGYDRFGRHMLADAIHYRGTKPVLDEELVLQYWFMLSKFTKLVAKEMPTKPPETLLLQCFAGGKCDRAALMEKMVNAVGDAAYEQYKQANAQRARRLHWNVVYFFGAGREEEPDWEAFKIQDNKDVPN